MKTKYQNTEAQIERHRACQKKLRREIARVKRAKLKPVRAKLKIWVEMAGELGKETRAAVLAHRKRSLLKAKEDVMKQPKIVKLMKRLDRAKDREAQARQRLKMIGAREYELQRKAETRCKIIIGGDRWRQYLEAPDQPTTPADDLRRLYESMNKRDKARFDALCEREKVASPVDR